MAVTTETIDSNTPHILVVDDDTRIRDLLNRYLIENGYRVTTAKDAAEARAHLSSLTFDIIILDVMMPGESGFEFTEDLRKKSAVPILMLTARGESEDRIKGLELGVDDYLSKPFEPRELLLRIGSIVRRTMPRLEENVEISMGPCTFDSERGELFRDGAPIKLTTAEISLLRILAANPGKAFSRLELSDQAGAGHERSVDVQITRLRKKIESDPKIPRFLQTVRGVGYMLLPD